MIYVNTLHEHIHSCTYLCAYVCIYVHMYKYTTVSIDVRCEHTCRTPVLSPHSLYPTGQHSEAYTHG